MGKVGAPNPALFKGQLSMCTQSDQSSFPLCSLYLYSVSPLAAKTPPWNPGNTDLETQLYKTLIQRNSCCVASLLQLGRFRLRR